MWTRSLLQRTGTARSEPSTRLVMQRRATFSRTTAIFGNPVSERTSHRAHHGRSQATTLRTNGLAKRAQGPATPTFHPPTPPHTPRFGQTTGRAPIINSESLRTPPVLRHTRSRRSDDRSGLRTREPVLSCCPNDVQSVPRDHPFRIPRWARVGHDTLPIGGSRMVRGGARVHHRPGFSTFVTRGQAGHTREGDRKLVIPGKIFRGSFSHEVERGFRGNSRSSRTWIPRRPPRVSGPTAPPAVRHLGGKGDRQVQGPCSVRGWRPGDLS